MTEKRRTSKRVASEAARILRDPGAGLTEKSVAGSALSQAPDRLPGRRRPKRRHHPTRWEEDEG